MARGQNGYTLVEAMMAVVVLGIAASGVVLPFSSGAEIRAEGMRRQLGARLAGDLLEEIANTPFDEIVATYHGYTEAEGQVKKADGTVFSDSKYARLSRSATCELVRTAQQAEYAPPVFIRATVISTYAGREVARLTRLVGK